MSKEAYHQKSLVIMTFKKIYNVLQFKILSKKYVIFSIYRLPKQNINYFLNSLSEGLDFYSRHDEDVCILGDFNAAPSNPRWTLFLENQNLISMIKNPTCFKSSNGSAILLIWFLQTIAISIKKVNLLKQGLVITTI